MDSVINKVVEKGLCVRCGACISVCPLGVLAPGRDLFPEAALPEKCTSCDMCILVCPGHEVDFPRFSREIFERDFDYRSVTGHVRKVYAASAVDTEVRETGSSGGLITALLVHHLETGRIGGALVVAMDGNSPTTPRPFIAATGEEIARSAQSKYIIVNPLIALGPVKKLPERLAIVGLPCQVHGVRKWMSADRRLEEKVSLIIGLVCNMTLERVASEALLARKKIRAGDVAKLEYRGGTWPGGIRVTLKDGSKVKLHEGNIKDGAFNFLKCLYYPPRCLTCIDFSNEFADLSVADPWIRSPGGGFMFPHNVSTVITRTGRGEEALAQAQKDGAITMEEISPSLLAKQFGAGYRSKRSGASVRIAKLAKSGKPVPDYGMPLPKASIGERIAELREALLRLPGKHRALRKAGTFLAFSWPGTLFMKFKEMKKRD
jgi:coenzyme F420 hydrogenase subunit beta